MQEIKQKSFQYIDGKCVAVIQTPLNPVKPSRFLGSKAFFPGRPRAACGKKFLRAKASCSIFRQPKTLRKRVSRYTFPMPAGKKMGLLCGRK